MRIADNFLELINQGLHLDQIQVLIDLIVLVNITFSFLENTWIQLIWAKTIWIEELEKTNSYLLLNPMCFLFLDCKKPLLRHFMKIISTNFYECEH